MKDYRSSIHGIGSRMRRILLMLIDVILIVSVYSFCFYYCRLEYFIKESTVPMFWWTLLTAIVSYVLMMLVLGVYASLWRYAQSKEFFVCLVAAMSGSVIFFAVSRYLMKFGIPLYFYLLFMTASTLALVTTRLLYRIYRDYRRGHSHIARRAPGTRALIVGGGAACAMLLDEIRSDSTTPVIPVAIVDDDIQKIGKRINDVKIVGTCDDIPSVCETYKVACIIIALPSATNALRAKILDRCAETSCAVKITPRLYETDEQSGMLNRLRDITVDELLGREPVDVADEEILSFVRGKTVLVTGGGGSIGSELCRQIALFAPSRLIIVDIFENNAYNIQQELIRKYGRTLDLVTLIASVRDFAVIDKIFREYRPDIVIHAAAHKHVPLMEDSPYEAIKNNIFGTLNVARAADANGVGKFIMISTDKAVNPTNVMGATKRACEMIVQAMNETGSATQFAAVRFGNVLGSSGSVIPLFKQQIAEGGPVTVTHPDIIRYFMTIPEASQLVLTAGAMARGGEIFVLDMGKPVKILDLARKMIQLSGLAVGKDIRIEFTGLRPGEKLYEELLMDEEGIKKTDNNKIFIGRQIDVDTGELFEGLERLRQLVSDNSLSREDECEAARRALMELVPTFRRSDEASDCRKS